MNTVKLIDIATIYNGNSINKTVKQEKYMKDVPGWNYIGTKDVGFDGKVTYKNGVIIRSCDADDVQRNVVEATLCGRPGNE